MNPNQSYRILIGAASLGMALACQSQTQDLVQEDKMARIRALILKRERPIAFYGKVVDQHGTPVEGVKIELHLRRHSANPEALFMAVDDHWLKTDNNGEFKFKWKKGLDCGVYGFKKMGYEYDRLRTMADYEKALKISPYSKPESPDSADFKNGYIPRASNPATPSLFYMRKLDESAYVLQRDAIFYFKPEQSNAEKGYDFIRGIDIQGNDLISLTYNDTPLVCDLKIRAIQDPKTRAWSVLLWSGTPGGGVLATEQFLYEAPKEGYQPSLSLGSDPKGKKLRCLFIRSRSPFIYTRIDLGEAFGDNGAPFIRTDRDAQDQFVIGGRAIVNPYGERILEEEKELPGEVKIALRKEVDASYRRNVNGRPPKPDLPKLVEEWKKNRPVVERVKEFFKR